MTLTEKLYTSYGNNGDGAWNEDLTGDDSALAPTPISDTGISVVDHISPTGYCPISHHCDEDIAVLLSDLRKNIDKLTVPGTSLSLTSSYSVAASSGSGDVASIGDDESSMASSPPLSTNTQDIHDQTSVADENSITSISSKNCTKKQTRTLQNCKWLAKFQELIAYKKTHGHCLVPHNWPMNLPLAKWVKRQRYQYKLKKQSKHNTMTKERETLLESIGFVWDSHRAAWEERLNDLREFKREHGHCNVPSNYRENRQLSIWVKYQRQRHKLYCKGELNGMTMQRVQELTGMGFVWALRNESPSSSC